MLRLLKQDGKQMKYNLLVESDVKKVMQETIEFQEKVMAVVLSEALIDVPAIVHLKRDQIETINSLVRDFRPGKWLHEHLKKKFRHN